jgi:hypothetical protein
MNKKQADVVVHLASEGYVDEAFLLTIARSNPDDALLLMAASDDPKAWQRIVAKVPGVCFFIRLSAKRLQDRINEIETLLTQIEALEKEDENHPKLKDLYFNIVLLGVLGKYDESQVKTWDFFTLRKFYKKHKKNVNIYIKSGQMVADLKKKGKESGLGKACKENKKK